MISIKQGSVVEMEKQMIKLRAAYDRKVESLRRSPSASRDNALIADQWAIKYAMEQLESWISFALYPGEKVRRHPLVP